MICPCGMVGSVTLPSWFVLVSQDVWIFFRFTPMPDLKRTITLARSTGLPLTADATCTVSFTGSDAVAVIARHVKLNRTILSIFIDSLCDIRYQKMPRTPGGPRHRFRRYVTASHRAFHRSGPFLKSPVAAEKEITERRDRHRPFRFHAGRRGERCPYFLDHVRLLERHGPDARKKFGEFPQCKLDDLSPRHRRQGTRGAHHQLHIAAFALVEHPLDGAVEQRGVRKLRDRPVEPEMDTGDRRVGERVPFDRQLRHQRP